MEIKRGHYVFVFASPKGESVSGTTASGAAYIGDIKCENFHMFFNRFEKKYTGMYAVKFFFIDDFQSPVNAWDSNKVCAESLSSGHRSWTQRLENMKLLSKDQEINLKLLLRDSLTISEGKIRPLKLAIEIANDIRDASGQSIDNVPDVFQEQQDKSNAAFMSALSELTGAVESANTVYPRQVQALTGVAVSDTVEGHQEDIEDSDGSVPNVNVPKLDEVVTVLNEIKNKIPTGEMIFDSTFRAFAHIKEPAWETESEYSHRRRQSKDEWNDIAMDYYPDTKPEDLPSVVDAMQKRYYRAYPKNQRSTSTAKKQND